MGKRWMPHGERPVCPIRIGYQFGLLYTAICPYNGDLFAMFLPNMTKDCFELFIEEFNKHTQKVTTLLLDKATCHTSANSTQQVKFVFFPSASPELNPVERFFKELRKELKCRVFEKLDQIETRIQALLDKYWSSPQLVISLAGFPYFYTHF